MRLRNTLVLALIFLALGAYLYFVERERVAVEEAHEQVLEFDDDTVTRITIEHPGRKIVLERDGAVWRLTEPVAAAADQRSVENLLSAVRGASIARTLENADAPATYGLDAPSATVQIRVGGDDLPVLKIGKKAPVGGLAYLQRGSADTVSLTADGILLALDKQVNDLRDRSVLSFSDESVTSITIDNGADRLSLRKAESGWQIEAPPAGAADADNIRTLLTTLRSLRAADFASDDDGDLASYGLAEPAQRVVLGLDDGTEVGLSVGSEKSGQLYAKSSQRPTIFLVPAWVRENLDRKPAYFRDKTIAHFEASDVAELRITRADDVLTLRRSPAGEWQSDAGKVRTEVVDRMVTTLASLKGYDVAAEAPDDLAAFGLDPPAFTIQATAADGADLATIRFGSYRGTEVLEENSAMRDGGDTVFQIRGYFYEQLDKKRQVLLAPETPAAATPGAAATAAPQP